MPAAINRISVRDGDPTGGLEFRVIFTEPVDLSTIGPEDFAVTGGSSATVTGVSTINADADRIDVQLSGDGLNAFTGDVGIGLAPSATITTVSDGQNINVSEAPRSSEVITLVGDGSEPPVEEPPVEEPPVEEPPVEEPPVGEVESTGNQSDTLFLDKVNLLGEEETSDDVLKFRTVFSDTAQNVSLEDWVVTGGSTATVTEIFVVNGGDNKLYDVTVSGGDLADFNGTVGIALAEDQNIVDADRDELPTAAPFAKNLIYTVTNDAVTPPSTGSGGGTPVTPITGGPTPTGPTVLESLLTPIAAANVLEISEIGNAKALSLKVDQSSIFSVGDVKIFSTDESGGNRTQVGGFSVLEDVLGTGFSPTFNLKGDSLASGSFLQFEITEKGITDVASPVALENGDISLDFGNGTVLTTALADAVAATDLTLDDAAAIDLTGLTGDLTATFSVYREAALTNTVGFYTTDTADGGIVDALTGNTIRPGDVGYKAAAIANQLDVQLSGENGQMTTFDASIKSGVFLGTFVVVDGVDPAVGEVFFSHQGANSDGLDHIKQVGDNAFGIEDQSGGGDLDFNDMVVSFKIEATAV